MTSAVNILFCSILQNNYSVGFLFLRPRHVQGKGRQQGGGHPGGEGCRRQRDLRLYRLVESQGTGTPPDLAW